MDLSAEDMDWDWVAIVWLRGLKALTVKWGRWGERRSGEWSGARGTGGKLGRG